MIHVGVIGCGRIAQVRHLPEYAENKNVAITGVYDLNHERAEADSMGQKRTAAMRNCWQIRKLRRSVSAPQITRMRK